MEHVCTHVHLFLELSSLLQCRVLVAFVFRVVAWCMGQAFSSESILEHRFSWEFPVTAALKVILGKAGRHRLTRQSGGVPNGV